MSITRLPDELEAALFEFVSARPERQPARLQELVARYPQWRLELTELADELADMQARENELPKPPPMSEEETSRLVQVGLSRFRELSVRYSDQRPRDLKPS
jgi:hypothetical protein